MKWYRSREELESIQLQDEREFKNFFISRGLSICKLDHYSDINPASKPDFELCKDSKKAIVEIKSRFSDNNYYKIASKLDVAFSQIAIGYDYWLRHSFIENPIQDEAIDYSNRIMNALKGLPQTIIFPHELTIEKRIILINEELSYNSKIEITLMNSNKRNKFTCTMLQGPNHDNMFKIDKKYFKNTLEKAKDQLADYFDNFPTGVIYFNHTPYNWDNYDILNFYGNPTIIFNRNPLQNKTSLSIGGDRLVGIEKSEWLSFLGFVQKSNDGLGCQIYRNGFAKNELDVGFFAFPPFEIFTIKPYPLEGELRIENNYP